jgi:hypothetical protein
MGAIEQNQEINQEIKRLSLRIALCRYELWEAVIQGTPLGLCNAITQELSICMLQRSALRNGRFEELPYPIRHLYKSH